MFLRLKCQRKNTLFIVDCYFLSKRITLLHRLNTILFSKQFHLSNVTFYLKLNTISKGENGRLGQATDVKYYYPFSLVMVALKSNCRARSFKNKYEYTTTHSIILTNYWKSNNKIQESVKLWTDETETNYQAVYKQVVLN
jgi:hypothetical protein